MSTATVPVLPPPRRTLFERVTERCANPLLRALLRSPLGDLAGDGLALLEITGRRTGRTVSVPVGVRRGDGARLVAVSRPHRLWWRNLRGGAAVVLTHAGARRAAWAAAHTAADSVTVTIEPAEHVEPQRAQAGLLGRWWRAVTLAEAVGFCVPAVTAAALSSASDGVLVACLLAAGTFEGTLLGLGQAYALRGALPAISTGSWVKATAAGAAFAWALGLIPAVVEDPAPALLAPAGVGILLSMGVAQWRVLRAHVPRAHRWIAATALAWAAGLAVFMAIATPLWHEGQPAALVALVGVGAGIAMASTVALVSGAALTRLISPAGP